MKRYLLILFSILSVPVFAADVTWNGKGGDYNLANPNNWSTGALPTTSDTMKLAKLPDDKAYVMDGLSTITVYQLTSADSYGPFTLDLGAGHSLLATFKMFLNLKNAHYYLTSGTLGIVWSGGERFFMGDNGPGGNTLTVTGPDSRLTSSKGMHIQVGTNIGRQRLEVLEGATVSGNVAIGVNAQLAAYGLNSNNVYVVDNSLHYVPADSEANPLTIGTLGRYSSAYYQNHAVFSNEAVKTIYMPSSQGHLRSFGHGLLSVSGGSTFYTKGDIDVGYSGDENRFEITGGSKVTCRVLNLASEVDTQALPAGRAAPPTFDYIPGTMRGNSIYASDPGTIVRTTSNCSFGNYALDGASVFDNGAELHVDNTFTFAKTVATNNVAYFGTNAVLDVLKGLNVARGDSGIEVGGANNRMIFDHARLYMTNNVEPGRNSFFGGDGVNNGLILDNGSRGEFTSAGGVFYVGCNISDNGYVKVLNGSELYLLNQVFYLGTETGSKNAHILIDNSTLAVTNDTLREAHFGRYGKNSLLEFTNGAKWLFFKSQPVISLSGGFACTNIVRATKGSYIEGVINYSEERQTFKIGGSAVGGFELDASEFQFPHIIRMASGGSNTSGSWFRLANGSKAVIYRIIMGETGVNGRIEVDDSELYTTAKLGTRTVVGSIQMGVNSSDYRHQLYITGRNAKVAVGESLDMGNDSLVQFTVGRNGFPKSRAVLTARKVQALSFVTPEHPATIRLVDDPLRINGGTYTLIQTTAYDIDWSKIVIDNTSPDSLVVVEQSARKLIIRAKPRGGMAIFGR